MPGLLHQSNRCEFNYDPFSFLYTSISPFIFTHSQLTIKNLSIQHQYNPYSIITQAETHQ